MSPRISRTPGLLHPAQQQPEPLEHELGIAAALDDEVAVEHAVDDRSLQPHRRRPGVGRAEQLERRVGRHQLHQRRRVDGCVGLPGDARRGSCRPPATQATIASRGSPALASAASTSARQAARRRRGGREPRRAATATTIAASGERASVAGHPGSWQAARPAGAPCDAANHCMRPTPRRAVNVGARMTPLLAFDTATERMTVALCGAASRSWSRDGAGGAQASAALVPAIIEPAGRSRPRPRRPRRDRLRPRPGRLHRPAHRLRGGPGAGLRRRQAGAADRQPAGRRRGCARRRGAATPHLGGDRCPHGARSTPPSTASPTTAGQTLAAPMLTDCDALARAGAQTPPEAVAGNALRGLRRAPRHRRGAARSPRPAPRAEALLRAGARRLARRRRRRRGRGAAALRARQGGRRRRASARPRAPRRRRPAR